MPIPPIEDGILAMVVMPSDQITADDVFVNTLFFRDDTAFVDFDDVADAVRTVLNSFYNTTHAPAVAPITNWLSPAINPALVEYRIYNLEDAPPRPPYVRTATWGASGTTTPLPNECAAVISYRSGPGGSGGGTLNRRRRGRIYIGPLGANTVAFTAGTDGDARITTGVLTTLSESAEDLITESLAADVPWMQYSRVANEMNIVQGGFVNDRYDTQRRRGFAESVRLTFP